MKDDNNNIISHTYSYFDDDEDIEKKNEYKFIIIATDTQINNLKKDTLIDEYFMDTT